jgi:hypothetical protein
MDAAVKEQWIKDLTSGEFKQGRGYLEKGGKFCCLGVLCFRAAEAGVTNRTETEDTFHAAYGGRSGFLPSEVVEWAGMSDFDGRYHDGDIRRALAYDNDGGVPFEGIAKTIDQYF